MVLVLGFNMLSLFVRLLFPSGAGAFLSLFHYAVKRNINGDTYFSSMKKESLLNFFFLTHFQGDGNLRYFQFFAGELRRVDEYRSNVPIKSFCFIPKL